MKAFDRLLIKVPEHTWGVAQTWFLPDYENWTNVQFDSARAQQVSSTSTLVVVFGMAWHGRKSGL